MTSKSFCYPSSLQTFQLENLYCFPIIIKNLRFLVIYFNVINEINVDNF